MLLPPGKCYPKLRCRNTVFRAREATVPLGPAEMEPTWSAVCGPHNLGVTDSPEAQPEGSAQWGRH